MSLILDADLLCIERSGRSYKWTGAELKSQVTSLAPVASITGSDPIVVTTTGQDVNISIKSATTSQRGATVLTNTVDNTTDKEVRWKEILDQVKYVSQQGIDYNIIKEKLIHNQQLFFDKQRNQNILDDFLNQIDNVPK